MGLLDQVLGGLSGSQSGGSSSMSPVIKAALLLMAAKAAQHYLSPKAAQPEAGQEPQADDSQGKITSGMLAGLPSLTGLGGLVEQFTRSGQGDAVNSWIGPGENKPISSDQLQNVLGPDVINRLQQQTGLPVDQLLNGLSQVLPQVVDKLTPQGRMPTEQEAARW
ncbi:YidB family protein [Microvirga terricola]|uniref:DUF937 domain-containing protein n=1 Tax=Microvirga terricola TaxID=2719797 RepID=A0ABX0VBV0_9HYPH|nr:YidB family protein [Microvirga terricola]NIX76983.1 DUF937 domain-containing protein [Microvirga terricola]